MLRRMWQVETTTSNIGYSMYLNPITADSLMALCTQIIFPDMMIRRSESSEFGMDFGGFNSEEDGWRRVSL